MAPPISDEELLERLPGVRIDADNADYWRGLLEHRLLINRCRACGHWHNPPRPVCPRCWSPEIEATPVSGRGVIDLFTVLHQGPRRGGVDYSGGHVVAGIGLAEQPGLRVAAAIVGTPPARRAHRQHGPARVAGHRRAARPGVPGRRRRRDRRMTTVSGVAGTSGERSQPGQGPGRHRRRGPLPLLPRPSGGDAGSLVTEACIAALRDAGLGREDVDGLCGSMVAAQYVQAALGIPAVTWFANPPAVIGNQVVAAVGRGRRRHVRDRARLPPRLPAAVGVTGGGAATRSGAGPRWGWPTPAAAGAPGTWKAGPTR